MLFLKENPTLKDFEVYVKTMEQERGFLDQTILERCLLLGEEVGELFKAVRKKEGRMGIDPASAVMELEDEIADVFIMLATIAARSGIDIEEAFRKKEEKNKKRIWIKHAE